MIWLSDINLPTDRHHHGLDHLHLHRHVSFPPCLQLQVLLDNRIFTNSAQRTMTNLHLPLGMHHLCSKMKPPIDDKGKELMRLQTQS
jgi:hypothetical protein